MISHLTKKSASSAILYVSTFPPRACGIATFTQDLSQAMDSKFNPAIMSRVLALNDNQVEMYNYPPRVTMQISQNDLDDYIAKAKEINENNDIKLVNIQHEYGIYGGEWGNYLLAFMEIINKPIVLTLHTILPKPEKNLKKITESIIGRAGAVVVMTRHAEQILNSDYGVNKEKIHIIPHGVHQVAFPDKHKAKKKLNLEGRIVLTSFGILSEDKGIEYAIASLPKAVKQYPNLLYLVLGATHPLVRKKEGEKYRNRLKALVTKLNLQKHVKFYDKYMSLSELIEFLKATDIYLAPKLNPAQAVSGALSYALSCACPVISTASAFAKEILSPERGILVGFKNSEEIELALLNMLKDEEARKKMGNNSYLFSRHMTWQNVALAYHKVFNYFLNVPDPEKEKLPAFKLDHLKRMTDSFGLIQFARYTNPDLDSGYCLDDNARALLVGLKAYENHPQKRVLDLTGEYLKFINFVQKSDGRFYNFVSGERKIIDKTLSEDAFGRAIWALGYLLAVKNLNQEVENEALAIFKKAGAHITNLESCRAMAFTIIGLSHILLAFKDAGSGARPDGGLAADIKKQLKALADKLVKRFDGQKAETQEKSQQWAWFEDYLTYSNYKMPEALFRAYEATGEERYLEVAGDSLKFLASISFEKGYLTPIGQDGWYFKNGQRAYFDQQPEDASSTVEALVKAYEITKNDQYLKQARVAFNWFLGKNYLNQMMYDEASGGCYDGLGKNRVNLNQGAESTLSYLLARLAIEKIK